MNRLSRSIALVLILCVQAYPAGTAVGHSFLIPSTGSRAIADLSREALSPGAIWVHSSTPIRRFDVRHTAARLHSADRRAAQGLFPGERVVVRHTDALNPYGPRRSSRVRHETADNARPLVDQDLNEIEVLLRPWKGLNSEEEPEEHFPRYWPRSSEDTLRRAFLLQMNLLHDAGILTPKTQVFYFLSGSDPFPGFGVKALFTADQGMAPDSRERWVEDWLKHLQASRQRRQYRAIAFLDKPFTKDQVHRAENVFSPALRKSWFAQIKPGDVIFLKYTSYWLDSYMQPNPSATKIQSWYDSLVREAPPGVFFVLIEDDLLPAEEYGYPTLSQYLLARYPALLEDAAGSVLGPENAPRLEQINQHPLLRLGLHASSGGLYFGLAGKLTILRVTPPTSHPSIKTTNSRLSRWTPERLKRYRATLYDLMDESRNATASLLEATPKPSRTALNRKIQSTNALWDQWLIVAERIFNPTSEMARPLGILIEAMHLQIRSDWLALQTLLTRNANLSSNQHRALRTRLETLTRLLLAFTSSDVPGDARASTSIPLGRAA